MGYPWPEAPLADGTGTTPADLQRIVGAQYMTSGILPNGGLTVEGTGGMAYKVNAGAAFMWTSYSARRGKIVPVDEVTVNTEPAPSTGSRTETIYADGQGQIRIVEGSTAPTGVALATFVVPAGITATTAAQQSTDRRFAIATGSSMGRLHYFHDPANGTYGNVSPMTLGAGRFFLPSDRLVRVDCMWTSSAEPDGNDRRTWGVANWRIQLTGATVSNHAVNWHYTGVHPTTQYNSITMRLNEGAHQINYVQKLQEGARFRHHKGGPDEWLGNRFEVWDMGAA